MAAPPVKTAKLISTMTHGTHLLNVKLADGRTGTSLDGRDNVAVAIAQKAHLVGPLDQLVVHHNLVNQYWSSDDRSGLPVRAECNNS